MQLVKTALLAYGGSGKLFHAPFLNVHEGYELIGAWERSKKNIQKDYPQTKSFDSLEDVLQSDAELIIVNTPIYTHYEYAKKALEAGKHVLVEKAFVATSSEAEELDNIAIEKNLKLCVYQNRRWDSDFLTTQNILKSGELGEILEAEIRFERYNPNLNPKAWKEKNQPGSGILMDLGAHIIDQALVLFGWPEAVFADIRTLRPNSEVNDFFDILLFYPNNRVRLKATFFAKEQLPGYVLQGRNGSFIKMRGDVQEDDLKLGKMPNRDNWGTEDKTLEAILNIGEHRKKIETLQGNYLGLFDDLYRSIVMDEEVPVPASEAVKSLKIMEAAEKSVLTSSKIKL
ncbi:Gfo/Idh/MocA family oxidoreductase [Chryseobacterium sp. POL2]|uniref:Gfo/Idh/MocA family oxidoreductase n=1 Tax=Chryseobacterium sp. POL2 TaxID=2713414 RepID=UPI0013E102C6|nr:Gfo/Idh/MocA family oxidoreductase [Chryseobacterium sp. POL2]QIG89138.1 Gfo/Idh/MocA family oxidoreductase [Chryseobacterium sp. POL2]